MDGYRAKNVTERGNGEQERRLKEGAHSLVVTLLTLDVSTIAITIYTAKVFQNTPSNLGGNASNC